MDALPLSLRVRDRGAQGRARERTWHDPERLNRLGFAAPHRCPGDTTTDEIAQLKERARRSWPVYLPFETITGLAAPRLTRFAGIVPGAKVLDVACGTGVVALTAAREGGRVTGGDLTPELINRAQENAALAQSEIAFRLGDVEELPFTDGAFDAVLSQFGHMFAPRPKVTVREMLRVLRPGGTLAFSTWPPEMFSGQMFALAARYGPLLPAGVPPPEQWGDPQTVRDRLGDAVRDLAFARDAISMPMLSPAHGRVFLESTVGVITGLVGRLALVDPTQLATFRRELESLIGASFEANALRLDYLLTRSTKA